MGKQLSRVDDLTDKRYGRLTVIGIHDTPTRKTYWVCQCDCGNIKVVRSDSLKCGAIRSCGCLKKEQDQKNLTWGAEFTGEVRKPNSTEKRLRKNATGHKVGGTRLYEIWQGIRRRCYKKTEPCYDRYGGRGITVCDEWVNDFSAFYKWAIENGYSDELTIDRIDNEKGYSPDNCRWTTAKEQARNRRSNINITIGNSTRTMTEWCEIFNVNYAKVNARYHRNGFTTVDELFNG